MAVYFLLLGVAFAAVWILEQRGVIDKERTIKEQEDEEGSEEEEPNWLEKAK